MLHNFLNRLYNLTDFMKFNNIIQIVLILKPYHYIWFAIKFSNKRDEKISGINSIALNMGEIFITHYSIENLLCKKKKPE